MIFGDSKYRDVDDDFMQMIFLMADAQQNGCGHEYGYHDGDGTGDGFITHNRLSAMKFRSMNSVNAIGYSEIIDGDGGGAAVESSIYAFIKHFGGAGENVKEDFFTRFLTSKDVDAYILWDVCNTLSTNTP